MVALPYAAAGAAWAADAFACAACGVPSRTVDIIARDTGACAGAGAVAGAG